MKKQIAVGIICLAIGLAIGLTINWTPKFIYEQDSSFKNGEQAGIAEGRDIQKQKDRPFSVETLESILEKKFTWYGQDDYAN